MIGHSRNYRRSGIVGSVHWPSYRLSLCVGRGRCSMLVISVVVLSVRYGWSTWFASMNCYWYTVLSYLWCIWVDRVVIGSVWCCIEVEVYIVD